MNAPNAPEPAVVLEDAGALCEPRTSRAPYGAIEIRILLQPDRDGIDLFSLFIPPEKS